MLWWSNPWASRKDHGKQNPNPNPNPNPNLSHSPPTPTTTPAANIPGLSQKWSTNPTASMEKNSMFF